MAKPRPTFENLPADKRERFIEAALEEFATHPYDQASISRVVAELGIAKGSFYQYFDDKLALFEWLVAESARHELAWHTVNHPPDDASFVERVRFMFVNGLTWMAQEPRWAQVAMRAQEPSREPRLAAVRRMQMDEGHTFIVALLEEAVRNGEIRGDLDLSLVSSLLSGMFLTGVLDAMARRTGLEMVQLVEDPSLGERVTSDDLAAVVDAGLAMVFEGLTPK